MDTNERDVAVERALLARPKEVGTVAQTRLPPSLIYATSRRRFEKRSYKQLLHIMYRTRLYNVYNTRFDF